MFRFITALALGLWASSATAQSCTEIRFARGASSGEVSGEVGGDLADCYSFASGAGQTARIQLFGSNTMCASVLGLIDCQNDITFTTQARTYRVYIGQLSSRAPTEPYTMRLAIR